MSAPLDRLEHIERHVGPNYRAFLPLLCESLTQDEIAERMGMGWTRRQVEHAVAHVTGALGLFETHTQLRRLRLLRMAAGLDPCFCEAEE